MSRASAAAIEPGGRVDSRTAQFLTRVYAHLFGAILALVALEVALFKSGVASRIAAEIRQIPWALILGGFIIVSWLASRMAYRLKSKAGQYAGLALYVVAKGLIFVPLLYAANAMASGVIEQAAQVTLLGAVGLTLVVFVTRKDFGFFRPFLFWGGTVALILIFASLVFGWHLGTWFSVAMIALSGASILSRTSGLTRRYRRSQYVGAALGLFAAVGMMFWYVLRIFVRGGR